MEIGVRTDISRRDDLIIGLTGLGVVAAIWCVITYGGFIRPVFLPTPTGMWQGLAYYQDRHWLIPAIWRSFWRVTKSLILVIIVGVPLGVLMGTFPAVDAFLRKIVSGGKSVPTTGVVGLIVVWFSVEERAKVVFLFIGAIFYMIILVKNAVCSVPEEYLRVARDLGASRRQLIWSVLFPGALPQIAEAIIVCNGIMWTYIVLGEYINSNEAEQGLGSLLFMSSRLQQPGQVYAALIVIAVISSLTDYIFHLVRRSSLDW